MCVTAYRALVAHANDWLLATIATHIGVRHRRGLRSLGGHGLKDKVGHRLAGLLLRALEHSLELLLRLALLALRDSVEEVGHEAAEASTTVALKEGGDLLQVDTQKGANLLSRFSDVLALCKDI